MAGETRGYLCEALTYHAVMLMGSRFPANWKMYWEEKPSFAAIKPDFTFGPSPDEPHVLILVTACDAPKNFLEKHLRNLCELFDAKCYAPQAPLVINSIFYSSIKPDLVRISEKFFDVQLLVDRDPNYGIVLRKYVESNHLLAGNSKEERSNYIANALKNPDGVLDHELKLALSLYSNALSAAFETKLRNSSMWNQMAEFRMKRKDLPLRRSRDTNVRRGLARWCFIKASEVKLLANAIGKNSTIKNRSALTYALPLNLLKSTVSGQVWNGDGGGVSRLTNMANSASEDLKSGYEFIRDQYDSFDKAAEELERIVENAPDKMARVGGEIRSAIDLSEKQMKFIVSRWNDCIDPFRLYHLLMECHKDPSMGIGDLRTVPGHRVWIYDMCVACLRAEAEANNDFGYNFFVSFFKRNRGDHAFGQLMQEIINSLGNVRVKAQAHKWVGVTLEQSSEPGRRGFQDWLNREKLLNPVVIGAFAFALSSTLRGIDAPKPDSIKSILEAVLYGLWNKLLNYPDFEPLPQILAGKFGLLGKRTRLQTLVNDLIDTANQEAGTEEVVQIGDSIIGWRSVTDAGKDHKRKELCARISCLRLMKGKDGFGLRTSVRKAFLVADGTFTRDDIKELVWAGWDAVFYPDEMDKLADAIV